MDDPVARELARAERAATQCADCPACRGETWWPVDTAALEVTCDCGHVLRLEPCGRLRDMGPAPTMYVEPVPASDPDDLEGL